jgi:hypothetical protein
MSCRCVWGLALATRHVTGGQIVRVESWIAKAVDAYPTDNVQDRIAGGVEKLCRQFLVYLP